VSVVGKKELIYQLVEEVKNMKTNIREVAEQLEKTEIKIGIFPRCWSICMA